MSVRESSRDRNPFERLAEEFAARLRAGEHPSIGEYVERYPDLADDIRELFPALALVEEYKPERPDLDISAATLPARDRGDLPEQLGDYRILHYLGEGGMGVVYEAVRESLHSRVALKVMHPQYRNRENYLRRFRTEARSAAQLHHTNIVSVFDYGVQDGVCFYAMRYIAGHSLDKILGELRQLRQEKTGLAPAASATLATRSRGAFAVAEPAVRMGAETASDLLRQTVTMGLLTGQYAAVSAPEATSGLPTSSDITDPAATSALGDRAQAVQHRLEFELRRDRGGPSTGPNVSHKAEPDKAAVLDSQHDSAGSLAGKSDDRYYREVARLGAQVADALAYAHKRGVLHRDIKPPNLILDTLGNLWITDFGLAKFEDGEDISQSQDLVGTLRYMAPERFRGLSDPRGDLYALGATLYELATLHPPFAGKNHVELIQRIERDPPVPPRQLDRRVPRDLETIVLKALAKNPHDRFATAEAMSDELRRFVENRPIRSRRIPFFQRFWRWCQRNPRLAAANIAAALLTTVLAVVSTVAAWTFRAQRNEIEGQRNDVTRSFNQVQRSEARAREALFESLVSQASATRFSRRMGQRFKSLAALRQAADIGQALRLSPDRFDALRDEAIACMALPDLEPTGRVITLPPNEIGAAFDPAMTRYAFRFRDGTISVRRLADDQEIARFQSRGDREFQFFFSPDGRYVASSDFPADSLTVWDVDRRAVAVNDPGPVSHSAHFSPDSRQLALTHENGELFIYELASGQPRQRWRGPGPAHDLAFREDAAEIAVLYKDKTPTCQILEAETGRLVRSIPLPAAGDQVAWSADGATLAIPCIDRKVYLWDAGSGIQKAVLEGHINGGLVAAFHPAGNLLATDGWEGRLWLWDPVLGRPWLNVSGGSLHRFSLDGRVVLLGENRLTTYQVEPAREYCTLAHPASAPVAYGVPSIRHDGRVLAVGTDLGVVLWDLARGIELAVLPIGPTGDLRFQPSGDLLTSGRAGVRRWPVRIDSNGDGFRIGPPHRLPLPAATEAMTADRSGGVVALAYSDRALVAAPDRTFSVGPLDDCRYVSVSPDGEYLATGSHGKNGVQVWRVRDATLVAQPVTEGFGSVQFSPDGKWLMRRWQPCRVWRVGTWREGPQIGGAGLAFFPDGRLVAVQDASKAIRLVETETGRTLAKLESPDLCSVQGAAFSPDGSLVVITTPDGRATHVWDLRTIRRRLAEMGLDWDAPPYSDDDPADASLPPLPSLQVDVGELSGHLEIYTDAPRTVVERATIRIQSDRNDADAYDHRSHALTDLGRFQEAIADLTQAIQLRPVDAHLRSFRGAIHEHLKQLEPAIADLEAALALKPDEPLVRERLALCCNNRAWELATGPGSQRDLTRALRLVERAVALTPGEGVSLNTLGVVQYRVGRYHEAIATLERSLAANRGQFDGFDLFFLAMAHQRLGHRDLARSCFDRAVRWVKEQKGLNPQYAGELAAFRAEAEAVLASRAGELPEDAFARH
jgi:serine/threonine protein kinase/WD40 repeat protein/tetratricopeptide (TPR) repeat protein